ncbi:MAG: O-acetyl-ADP-ribose deacetylase [Acutalibacteraceae bacterium]
MPLKIVRNDITKIECDAIVNAANSSLLGGGGVDGAIHRAAGRGLLEECRKLGGCKVGQAKITGAYNLPCKYVIHTVGPVWYGGMNGEEELLRACYENSLALALKNGCESVAFPLISSGAYLYPKDQALKVAVDVIGSFLLKNEMLVYLVIFDKKAYNIGEKLFSDIQSYIDDNYVEAHSDNLSSRLRNNMLRRPKESGEIRSDISENRSMPLAAVPVEENCVYEASEERAESLDEALKQIDESFSQMLLRKIDEKGMTDAQCYKKANIDRKLFSKIRSDIHYKPRKNTVIAFAVALELSLAETTEMLLKAGFALSHSNKFDIIIEFFIKSGNYNIFEINEALFAFDQSLLGC